MSHQRQRYHSIPLRRQAHLMHKAGQIQTHTSGEYARPDCPMMEARTRQTVPTEAPQRLVPRHHMPVVPDTDTILPLHTSAIRYTDSQGRHVIQQGKHRLVFQRTPKQRRRFSRVLFVGIGMLAMLFFWLVFQAIAAGIQAHTLDAQYSYPRFWQTDQVLGLDHDSPSHKTHLLLQNINGHVFLLVLPAGDVTKPLMYSVANLYGDDAGNWPVTATFEDANHDGKIDVIVAIDDQQIVFFNTGTGLKPQAQP